MKRRSLIQLVGGAALGSLVPRRAAAEEELSRYQQRRLAAYQEIRVPLDFDPPQGPYFGGLVYQKVEATVDEVMAIASDPGMYTRILSNTLEARVLSRRAHDMQVYLRQGEGGVSVSYVMLVRRESRNLLRFRLDPAEPHAIDDVWGYLRVEPWIKPPWLRIWERATSPSVMTWCVLMRIDSDWLRLRHSETIRRAAMQTPGLIARVH